MEESGPVQQPEAQPAVEQPEPEPTPVPAPEPVPVEFSHANYELVNGDRIKRKASAPPVAEDAQMQEEHSVLEAIISYVQQKLRHDYGFVEIWVPQDEVENEAKCSVLMTDDWQNCEKLLVILQNAVGSQLGVWSRTLCLQDGLARGSMLPYVERARREGYGVAILRPNANSVMVPTETGKPKKISIHGSSSPEEHTLFVWDNFIAPQTQATHIALLGYGNGASLCKEILQRQIVRSQGDEENRIKAIATIEASLILEEDDAQDVKNILLTRAVNWESSPAPAGYRLTDRAQRLGCTCLSVGDSGDVQNVAWSVLTAMESVFRYLGLAVEQSGAPNLSRDFAESEARAAGHNPDTAEAMAHQPQPELAEDEDSKQPDAEKKGFFSKIFGRNQNAQRNAPAGGAAGGTLASPNAAQSPKAGGNGKLGANDVNLGQGKEKLSVADFDLMKVVGKGAFGKVMLVQKKSGVGEGQIFAMKVLKKAVIAAKGQVEHTKSERSILCEIRHPFVVRLRFAFQSDDKLYLVTDYYNGGSLFYHLRKSRSFSEDRARFYAAELLTALDHLHKQNVIYRDLKLENVLMDSQGHIALTDFGLSKQNIDSTGGATTFCGTAEYIAPELLKGQRYGAAVDWWSFGILLYEMMAGRTPFYDKNRKLMFYKIINTAPQFPPHFSPEACTVLRALLNINPESRLGSVEGGAGAEDIINSDFFRVLNFEDLLEKRLDPPFTPEVQNEIDTKYVPKAYLQAEAKDSFVEKKKGDTAPAFEQFTYLGDSALDS